VPCVDGVVDGAGHPVEDRQEEAEDRGGNRGDFAGQPSEIRCLIEDFNQRQPIVRGIRPSDRDPRFVEEVVDAVGHTGPLIGVRGFRRLV